MAMYAKDWKSDKLKKEYQAWEQAVLVKQASPLPNPPTLSI